MNISSILGLLKGKLISKTWHFSSTGHTEPEKEKIVRDPEKNLLNQSEIKAEKQVKAEPKQYNPGDIIQMSDRKYLVGSHGEWRRMPDHWQNEEG